MINDENGSSEKRNEELDPRSFPKKISGKQEKEELLSNFLSRIGSQDEEWGNVGFEQEGLGAIPADLQEYPVVRVTTDIERKIVELQQISTSIEHRIFCPSKDVIWDSNRFKVKYATVLNKAQQAAVATIDKPVLVIAGAGSGKTRVIVYRVSYLIERGVDPHAILLLTFTRKSAREMLNRVGTLLHDKSAGHVTGGTFHSFANYILRKYANLIGLPPNFTIIDTADAEDIIDLIRTELKYNTRKKMFPRKERLHDIISYSRNKSESITSVVMKQYSGLEEYIDDIELIFKGYTKYKQLSRILDFDDLTDILCKALKMNPRFLHIVQNSFQYIMVDEFQDTNKVQNEIVCLIAQKHGRIMAVGDDSQSIYAFRGANYENILRFPEAFPDSTLIKIEENYRSNQYILDFTNAIIDASAFGFKKMLYTQNNSGHLPVVRRLLAQDDEAIFIVDRIMGLIEEGVPMGQIAILNRADWHNRYIQAELNRRGIPYVVVGGFKFSERMHIKDIVAYLKLTYNPSDAVSWHRVLKYIGGIGQITASKLVADLQKQEHILGFEAYKSRKFYNELFKMGKMLSEASQAELSLARKIEIIIEYYAPVLKARHDDYYQRMEDVSVLLDLSHKYQKLDAFLSDFTLDPPSKRVVDQAIPLIDESEEQGKITISTVHSAKGLEWYAVFIPHALEGLFPSNRANNLEEMEEERRLFYVACSRAKEELYITYPRNIYSYDAFFHLPSRFLVEIDRSKFLYETV
jgi:DNA helicase II / ATP-dependent DNA helicase PcrA